MTLRQPSGDGTQDSEAPPKPNRPRSTPNFWLLSKSGGGAIVNISSIVGIIGFAGASVYTASKHAVVGLTKCAALEHARNGLRINVVSPGAVVTDMFQRFTGNSAEMQAGFANMHPMGRAAQPEEVARAVLFLCSDGASFMTGQSLNLDGGFTIQ